MYIYPAVSGVEEFWVHRNPEKQVPSSFATMAEIEKRTFRMKAEDALTKAGFINYRKFHYGVLAQKMKDTGPIPEGTYWINPAQISKAGWLRNTAAWGDYRITIHPFTTTETYNRGGFFIHGGWKFGSKGCIDLATHMNRFISDLKKEVDGQFLFNMCQIHLIVNYK